MSKKKTKEKLKEITKKQFTRKKSDASINTLIEFYSDNAWFTAAVAKEMGRISGHHYFRQEVSMWLNPDPERRIEPRHGVGLFLNEVGAMIIEEEMEKRAKILDELSKTLKVA